MDFLVVPRVDRALYSDNKSQALTPKYIEATMFQFLLFKIVCTLAISHYINTTDTCS